MSAKRSKRRRTLAQSSSASRPQIILGVGSTITYAHRRDFKPIDRALASLHRKFRLDSRGHFETFPSLRRFVDCDPIFPIDGVRFYTGLLDEVIEYLTGRGHSIRLVVEEEAGPQVRWSLTVCGIKRQNPYVPMQLEQFPTRLIAVESEEQMLSIVIETLNLNRRTEFNALVFSQGEKSRLRQLVRQGLTSPRQRNLHSTLRRLNFALPREIEDVDLRPIIVPDCHGLLSENRWVERHQLLLVQRIGFVRNPQQYSTQEMRLFRAYLGPLWHANNRGDWSSRNETNVVWLTTTNCPALSPLNPRSKQFIWNDPAPNARIAEVSRAIEQWTDTALRAIGAPHSAIERRTANPPRLSILILVESVDHCNLLRRRLPGWMPVTCLDPDRLELQAVRFERNSKRDSPGIPGVRLIAPASVADAIAQHVDLDVIINGSPHSSGSTVVDLVKQNKSTPAANRWVFDFRSDFDPLAREGLKARMDSYTRMDWLQHGADTNHFRQFDR